MAVIREKTRVFNQPVGVVRTDAGAGDVGRAISNVASRFQEIAFREAAEDARKKGIEIAEAVEEKKLRTINPETGKPEAFKAPKGFGRIAAASYQGVIDKRYEDSINNELRVKAQEIALKYPFDPESYDEVMSDYIGQMSENAEGRYKTYVDTTGSKFLALSKLNIQERVASRAREAAANSILQGVSNGKDEAFNVARAGGFIPRENEEISEASAIAEREIANTQNGVSSALLKVGADESARKELNQSIALGGLEYILRRTASSTERNAIELAIRTRGGRTGEVPESLLDDVKELLKYIDPSNIDTVLSHSSRVSADYNAVETDIANELKAEMAQKSRESELQYSDTLLDFGSNISNVAIDGFSNENPLGVGAALGQINMMYSGLKSSADSRFSADSTYTRAEYESDLRDARQQALRPLLIQAASEGNVEELRIALNTRNPEDMKNLTAKQREFIHGLYKSDFFNPTEDISYAREVLSASKNDLRISAEREKLRFEISQSVTEAGKLAESGGLSDEAFDKLVNNIKKNIGPKGLSSEQAESEINRLTKQRSFGLVEIFSRFGTSRDLNNLATYIDSGGQRTEGMSPDVIAAGNAILEKTPPDNRDAVVSKINGLKSTVASEEAEVEDALELQNAYSRITAGGGNVNEKDDRVYSQDILDNLGIDLGEFDKLDDGRKSAVLSLMRSAAPQGFIDTLDQITSGLPVKNADSYLNLFAILSNDPTETGMFINRFGDALDGKTVELLNDVNSIRITIGGNVNEIATTLIERQNDPKSNLQMNTVLGDKTPTEYATEYAKSDSIIGLELAASVEDMARTGKSARQIDARLDALIDQKYPKSKHIADPRFPAGSIKRSRYALEAQFPEKEERIEFVAAVESQLPSGYALIPNLDTEDKKVYLVPDESTAGVRYFSYFVDENEELRPLIYDDDNGIPTWPTFGRDDISDYYKRKDVENKAELSSTEAAQAKAFELQRQIRDIDPSVSAFTRGLGAGGL